MRKIDLDELPQYTPWPARLLNHETWAATPGRSVDTTYTYYNSKYQWLFDYNQTHSLTYEKLRVMELEGWDEEVAMSRNGRLYAATMQEAMESSIRETLRFLRAEAMLTGSVVDLGCGYGYLLYRLQQCVKGEVTYRGGELTQAGVALGQALGTDVHIFDFYAGFCKPLELVDRPSVVTTSYAMHQLHSAEPAVELLAKYRERIATVVCLEPEEDHFGEGLLGMLRTRYGRARHYSADLLRVLKGRSDVTIEIVEEAAVGANALLPGTLTVWSFK